MSQIPVFCGNRNLGNRNRPHKAILVGRQSAVLVIRLLHDNKTQKYPKRTENKVVNSA